MKWSNGFFFSCRYTIYYGVGETALKLGAINAAVLSTSHKRISRHYTAFSVDFVAEGNPIVLEQLDIKLRAKEKAPLTKKNIELYSQMLKL